MSAALMLGAAVFAIVTIIQRAQLMSAIDNLNMAISNLKAEASIAIARIVAPPGPPADEAVVQAAADEVNRVTAALHQANASTPGA